MSNTSNQPKPSKLPTCSNLTAALQAQPTIDAATELVKWCSLDEYNDLLDELSDQYMMEAPSSKDTRATVCLGVRHLRKFLKTLNKEVRVAQVREA